MKRFILFVIIALFILSCAPRTITQPQVSQRPEEVSPQEKKEEVIKEPETIAIKKDEVIEKPAEGVDVKEEKMVKEVIKKDEFSDIYFDFDKYNIRDDAKPVLDNLASYLRKDTGVGLIIEGHCDERGTNQYNLALGERRANAVKQYLMIYGVGPERLETVTYGEERPLCREKTEECYSKNRRAHFVIFEVEKKR